jgi:translation initiation factor IF-2
MEKDTKNQSTLTGKLELKKTFDAGKIKQSFSHGRSRSVSVEVKKKRSFGNKVFEKPTTVKEDAQVKEIKAEADELFKKKETKVLTEEISEKKPETSKKPVNEIKKTSTDPKKGSVRPSAEQKKDVETESEKTKKLKNLKLIKVPKKQEERRKGKLTISEALDEDNGRVRSLAAVKRAREKAKLRLSQTTDTKEQNKEKKKREVIIPDFIPVNELGVRMAERTPDLIKALMKLGVMATINQTIDGDTAELVAIEFGHTPRRVSDADVEIGLSGNEDKVEQLKSRPPVVTIMGHVDHGKTSLLDAIREKKVTQTEAGGITQHIGAYMIETPNKGKITFLDTPGHAAFSQMRARGSNITDIVILVVAADDSVNEQTVEAISHAKASKCPVIVAVNKIDLPAANPQKVEADLLSHEVISEKMGGDTVFINVSAKNKTGLDDLIDAILLQAEILDLRANDERSAEGTVIESKVEKGRGPVISVLVQKGNLKVGDIVIAGKEWGKVRALSDEENNKIIKALPSYPVEILGLSGAPQAGDEFVVVENESRAREVAQYRDRIKRQRENASLKRTSIEQMISDASSDNSIDFPMIIKADVHGSKEAIEQSLLKIESGNIKIKILHTGIGEINESDVSLSTATKAIIVGFNVRTNVQARNLAKRDNVTIKYYSIIYEVIDEINKLMKGMQEPDYKEKVIGQIKIKKVFKVAKSNNIAGCEVIEGIIKPKAKVRVIRNNEVISKTEISTLRREKNEVKEVKAGQECGIGLLDYEDFEEEDKLECFILEAVDN